MAGIKQLAKFPTGHRETDRAISHIADTLNPLLRTLPIPADFRFAEVAGLNGAAPTFQLQYKANNAQGWAGIATFTSAGLLVQPAWTPVVFAGAWANYGFSNNAVQYLKDSQGFVHLRGTAAGGVVPSTIFTLPAGFRPQNTLNFPVPSNGAFGYVSISGAGAVALQGGSNVWASLEGITFLAEQ